MSFEPVKFILERVGQVLFDEVKFLGTDKDKLLENLREHLELAQSFVRDVEDLKQQSGITNMLETESKHVKRLIPQSEDYLDELYLEEESKKIQPTPSILRKFKACFFYSNTLVHRHVVIDAALKLIDDLVNARTNAGPFQRPNNVVLVTQGRGLGALPNLTNEEFIVGLDEDVKTLVTKLKGTDGECTTILGIAGMGGSGKTTLTRKLYNHEEIKGHFAGRLAWVCVSQVWDASKLLRAICVQLGVSITEGEFPNVCSKLLKFLETSSCLIVLDDVWDTKALQELLPPLLPGGKVLITTRNIEILDYQVQTNVYIHEARKLTKEQSWELFSKIVCSKWKGIRDFDDDSLFANPAKQMLEKCDGLALAIVALAGLLSVTYSIQDWIAVKDRVSSIILRKNKGLPDYKAVKSMLELSFLNLGNDLKPCFLYLGIYPEDSEICVDELIQLWIGEGLIRSDLCEEGETLEDLGMDFVNELVQRCMVQVVSKTYTKYICNIQVHDLMRELCIEKARESGFFGIASQSMIPSNFEKYSLSRRTVHVSYGDRSHFVHTSHLRSVIRLCGQFIRRIVKLEIPYGKMKLLRVLHLEGVHLGDAAMDIGNLTLLRYLNLKKCEGVTYNILESIKKLINMLTLVVEFHWLEDVSIPNNMVGSMEQLRCLQMVGGPGVEFEGSSGVGGLRSLQQLVLQVGEWLSRELPIARFIVTLQTLALRGIHNQVQLDAVYRFVNNPSNHLRDLMLSIEDESGLEFDMQELKCCSILEHLTLKGRVRESNGPFLFPPNLLSLDLRGNKIKKADHLKGALASLHQLKRLELYGGTFEGHELTMTGLLQLQKLTLYHLENLREWRIDQGSLPQLKELHVLYCPRLEGIPEEIRHIPDIKICEVKTYNEDSG